MVVYRLLLKVTALGLMCTPVPIMPVITHINVWRKYHANEYHYCYYLPDWHHDYKDSSLGEGQRDDIIAIAKMTKNPLVIVESAADYNGSNNVIALGAKNMYDYHQEFKDNTKALSTRIYKIPSVLCSGLLPLCQKQGIATYNAECRHFKYAAASWQESTQDFNRHLLELASHKDFHPLLTEFYNSLDAQFERITQTVSQKTINDILADTSISAQEQQKRALQPSKDLDRLGFDLLNAKTVLALVKGQAHTTIFICIGASHVEKLENSMPSLGYTKVLTALDKPFLRAAHGDITNKIAINNVIDLKQAFMDTIFPYDPTVLR